MIREGITMAMHERQRRWRNGHHEQNTEGHRLVLGRDCRATQLGIVIDLLPRTRVADMGMLPVEVATWHLYQREDPVVAIAEFEQVRSRGHTARMLGRAASSMLLAMDRAIPSRSSKRSCGCSQLSASAAGRHPVFWSVLRVMDAALKLKCCKWTAVVGTCSDSHASRATFGYSRTFVLSF